MFFYIWLHLLPNIVLGPRAQTEGWESERAREGIERVMVNKKLRRCKHPLQIYYSNSDGHNTIFTCVVPRSDQWWCGLIWGQVLWSYTSSLCLHSDFPVLPWPSVQCQSLVNSVLNRAVACSHSYITRSGCPSRSLHIWFP